MLIASRTPEGEPCRCSICGRRSFLEPSITAWDAVCPYCGWLLWCEPANETTAIDQAELLEDWLCRFRELKGEGRLRFSLAPALVHCIRELTPNAGVGVWRVSDSREWNPLAHAGVPMSRLLKPANWKRHADLITAVAHSPEMFRVGPNSDPQWTNGNVTDSLLYLQRICREDDVLVWEIFLPAQIAPAEAAFVQTVIRSVHDIVAIPGMGTVRTEIGIDFAPPSSIDPPVQLPPSRVPRDRSWWKRLVAAFHPGREKTLA